MTEKSTHKSNRLNEFQVILILITATFLIIYVSKLRVVDDRLYRSLPSNAPLISFLTLVFSLYLLRMIFREFEPQLIEEKRSSRDLLDVFILLVLMFPGTGLSAIILPRMGFPEWIPFAMRGWTYVFLPTVYVLMWKKKIGQV